MQSHALGGQFRDFRDGYVVACRDVVDGVAFFPVSMSHQNGIDDVIDVDVALALLAVSQDIEPFRILQQASNEVEADPMCLVGPDDIAKTEGAATQVEQNE